MLALKSQVFSEEKNFFRPQIFRRMSVRILGELKSDYSDILTNEALSFLFAIHDRFETKRQELLQRRNIRQKEIDSGIFPTFLEDTKQIREVNTHLSKFGTIKFEIEQMDSCNNS